MMMEQFDPSSEYRRYLFAKSNYYDLISDALYDDDDLEQEDAMMFHSNLYANNNYNYNCYNICNDLNNNDEEEETCTTTEGGYSVEAKYIPIRQIAKGYSSVISSYVNMKTKENVAIKKVKNVFANIVVEPLMVLKEMKILRYIHHDNVIALKDVRINSPLSNFEDIYLVYQLMDMNLEDVIYSKQLPLSQQHCQYFLLQILRGLNHLHAANIIHCYLKPKHILVNNNLDLKICDLLFATSGIGEGQKVQTERVSTSFPWYRAPELLTRCKSHDKSIDIWSVGCIFAQLLRRKPLFMGDDNDEQLEQIIEILGPQPESELEFIDSEDYKRFVKRLSSEQEANKFCQVFADVDPLGLDLLQKMLTFNPNKRITAREALEHPYLVELAKLCPSPCPYQDPFILDVSDDADDEEIRSLMVAEMKSLNLQP